MPMKNSFSFDGYLVFRLMLKLLRSEAEFL